MAADQRQAFVAQDREIMDIYERRQKAQWDYASDISSAEHRGMEKGIEKGREKGLEEGMEKGKEKGFVEVARNALAEGATVEFVQKITGLDTDTIAGLRPAKTTR